MGRHLGDTVHNWKKKLQRDSRLNDPSKLVESKRVGQTKMIQLVLPPLPDESCVKNILSREFQIYNLVRTLDCLQLHMPHRKLE